MWGRSYGSGNVAGPPTHWMNFGPNRTMSASLHSYPRRWMGRERGRIHPRGACHGGYALAPSWKSRWVRPGKEAPPRISSMAPSQSPPSQQIERQEVTQVQYEQM